MSEAIPSTTDATLGEVTRDAEMVVLRYRRRLAHPPEKVWQAITQSEHLHHWFPADIIGDRAEGAELTVRFWPEAVEHAGAEIEASGLSLEDPALAGRVLVWDPPRTFAFSWDTEQLRFDLASDDLAGDGDGTALTLTVRAEKPAPRGFQSTAAGYHLCLDALVNHVGGGDGQNPAAEVTAEGTAALESAYAARMPAS